MPRCFIMKIWPLYKLQSRRSGSVRNNSISFCEKFSLWESALHPLSFRSINRSKYERIQAISWEILPITSRVESCCKAPKIREMISKFVFLSRGYGRLWGVHFGRLARFPTSLLLVSGFRAAGRQRLACESGDTPGSGPPVTHPYLCFLGNEAHFLVPGSHFVFVPAFCFSAAPANAHTTLSFTLLELFHSES